MTEKLVFKDAHKIHIRGTDMKALTAILLILLSSTPALHAADFQSEGLKEIGRKTTGSETLLEMTDSDGRKISVQYNGELTDDTAARIIELRKIFAGWNQIKTEGIKFLVSYGRIDIVIFPGTLAIDGKDMLPYIPAGINLSYTDELEYNFRITTQNLFIKIQGTYMKEDDICLKIQEAVNNPHDYIRKRDPEFILAKLTKLEERCGKLEDENRVMKNAILALHNTGFFRGPTAVSGDLVKRVIALKKADPALKADQLREKLRSENIEASDSEISLILALYFNEFK
jgi:hypothetical protein